MPDILIRGMKMPKTCTDCHDADLPTAIAWLCAKCPWAHGIIDPGVYDLRHERHPDCPLHELPPHGDLIDRGCVLRALAVARGLVNDQTAIDIVERFIKDTTVVVPAERREE